MRSRRIPGAATLILGVLLALGCSTGTPNSTESPEPTAEPSRPTTEPAVPMHPELDHYLASVLSEAQAIPTERAAQLDRLAAYIVAERQAGRVAQLTFICTHNSRRSQMSQLWAQTAAAYYGVDGIVAYSGGTESTAFNPRAVAALRRAGFELDAPPSEADNPRYEASYGPDAPRLELFSKTYDDPANPAENFAAVMTCSDADRSCPFVPGASLRIAVPFDDPKQADGTDEETTRYDERCLQIAAQMFYLLQQVANA